MPSILKSSLENASFSIIFQVRWQNGCRWRVLQTTRVSWRSFNRSRCICTEFSSTMSEYILNLRVLMIICFPRHAKFQKLFFHRYSVAASRLSWTHSLSVMWAKQSWVSLTWDYSYWNPWYCSCHARHSWKHVWLTRRSIIGPKLWIYSGWR